jgi:hypothetical protein
LSNHIAQGEVMARNIGLKAIQTEHINDGAIDSNNIMANAVLSEHFHNKIIFAEVSMDGILGSYQYGINQVQKCDIGCYKLIFSIVTNGVLRTQCYVSPGSHPSQNQFVGCFSSTVSGGCEVRCRTATGDKVDNPFTFLAIAHSQ